MWEASEKLGGIWEASERHLLKRTWEWEASERHLGGGLPGDTQETPGDTQETPRRFPGDTQETPRILPGDTQETPRRHPGDTQETPRRHPGGTQRHPEAPRRHPGGSEPENLENDDFCMIYTAYLTNGRKNAWYAQGIWHVGRFFIDFYWGKSRDPLFRVRVTKVGITKSAV